MNKNTRKKLSKEIFSDIILDSIIKIAIYVFIYLALLFIARYIFDSFDWEQNHNLYLRLRNLYLIIMSPINYLFIIFLFVSTINRIWKKLFSYITELSLASENIIKDDNKVITLPSALYPLEINLNNTKVEFQRNLQMAREAEKKKNDLIVYLAHDLKTPLTSVIGYLNLIEDEKEISPDLKDKYNSIALDKALRLEDLINEFFDITRFNLSTLILEKSSINLSLMVEQMTYEFLPILKEKNLSIDLNIEKDIYYLCDVDKMERVFDNILKNAINYSYSNSEIKICLFGKEDNIIIKFENNGRNIPKEKLDKIFDQFYRVDSSRGTESGGSGLGLAISKEIIEHHGGNIYATSEDEKITFTIIL